MKNIYILLTRTNTYPARMIRSVTASRFSHVSIALGDDLKEFFSYARRKPRFILPAGFIREELNSGILRKNWDTECLLYRLPVSDEAYERIKNMIATMEAYPRKYRYNLVGLLLCGVRIPYERRYRYFCSQFVATVLQKSGAATLPRVPSLIRPMDFSSIAGIEVVYNGVLRSVSVPETEKIAAIV